MASYIFIKVTVNNIRWRWNKHEKALHGFRYIQHHKALHLLIKCNDVTDVKSNIMTQLNLTLPLFKTHSISVLLHLSLFCLYLAAEPVIFTYACPSEQWYTVLPNCSSLLLHRFPGGQKHSSHRQTEGIHSTLSLRSLSAPSGSSALEHKDRK